MKYINSASPTILLLLLLSIVNIEKALCYYNDYNDKTLIIIKALDFVKNNIIFNLLSNLIHQSKYKRYNL